MDSADFGELKRRVIERNRACSGAYLAELLVDFDAGLDASGIYESVVVRATGDPDSMLIATCTPSLVTQSLSALADATRRAWQSCLRPTAVEFHTLTVSETEVILEFVSQVRATGHYVTGRIIVDMYSLRPPRRKPTLVPVMRD